MTYIVKPGLTTDDIELATTLSLKGIEGENIQFVAKDGDVVHIERCFLCDYPFADPLNPTPEELEKEKEWQRVLNDMPIGLVASILEFGAAIASGFAVKVLLTEVAKEEKA